MRLFMLFLMISIATVLTGGWFWMAVFVWAILACLFKAYDKLARRHRLK